jgi:PhoPQ-activated pathogenicity-related protein
MKHRLTCLAVVLAAWTFPAAPALAAERALDRYVAEPDPAYRFSLVRSYPSLDETTHVLEMTSQTWLSPKEVDRPEWKHWLVIVVARKLTTSTGLLFIGGGKNGDAAPVAADPMLARIARNTGAVAAELRMVPNQPLLFHGERRPRSEDSLIAYAWDKFLRTGEARWLPRLPMTKAAVRAMDTVTEFLKSEAGGGLAVDRFVVCGGSKRGWTTWTTAAVDNRVVAIVPFVIDLLNLEPSMIHHWRAYGFWAPAIADYEQMGIMNWMGTPQFRALLREVEPYEYRERFTMPKLIVNATGDQFFLPDSSQFYFDDLPGEKYLRYVPNADHSLRGSDAAETLVAFFEAIIRERPRPRFSWTLPPEGGIVVKTEDKPGAVTLWQATNPVARDFRLDRIGPAFKSSPVEGEDGVYRALVQAPPKGWTAYFLELTFPTGGRYPLKLTTPVRVVPDTLPYPPPKPRRKPPIRWQPGGVNSFGR